MTFQLRANLNLPVLFAFAAKSVRSEEFQVYMLTFFYGVVVVFLKHAERSFVRSSIEDIRKKQEGFSQG
jgi:hypothetical protein